MLTWTFLRWLSSGMLRRVVWQKFDDVSQVMTGATNTASMIALMMVAVSTCETSVYFYKITRRSIPEGCNLRNMQCYLSG
jgi:hypothetical protein